MLLTFVSSVFFCESRVQKKGSAASGAAREKIAGLQEHASKVEDLLKSMQVSIERQQVEFCGCVPMSHSGYRGRAFPPSANLQEHGL